jgi:cyclic pyranopterin phosphate synthase
VLSELRKGAAGDSLTRYISGIWAGRADRYSDERSEREARGEVENKPEMSYLGG